MEALGDLPIGKSVRSNGQPGVDISADGVTAWIEFATHPFADQVWNMVLRGEVNAASINVIPVRSEQRYIGGRLIPVYTQSKLLEWSLVAVPCNAQAVLRSQAKGQQERAEIEAAWEARILKAVESKLANQAEGNDE